MKKSFKTLVLAFTLLLLGTSSARALTVSPNSGTHSPNAEQTIAVLADPPPGVYAVQLKLRVEGATIVPGSFDPAFALSIGTCTDDSEVYATSTTVCVDMSRGSAIETGTLLGNFRIKFNSGSTTAVIKTDVENGYLVGTEVAPDENRVLGTYNISVQNTPTTAPLPITGIEDYPVLVVVAGVMLVVVGVGFFIWRERSQDLKTN